MKGYTDFMAGFLGPQAIATKPIGEMKYMDWEKAKQICQEHPWSTIRAGLQEDWNNTSDIIFDSGKWIKSTFVYGCSCWATPIVDVDGEEIECWTYKETSTRAPSWWGKEYIFRMN